ncbi:MAG: amino acid/amide transporter substrate-binding protein family [Ilumatobacteraceae bacterium]|nr:amino acid/amide transporter substrate-binding protein family [Ilumatobacteraceae bacterium]
MIAGRVPGSPRLVAAACTVVVGLLAASCGTRLAPSAFTTLPPVGVSIPPAPTSAGGASDVGITATSITLGLIVSKTSPLGQDTFSGPMYGAQAYVNALNAAGGLAGRHVDLDVCDDGATGAGNTKCVQQLIDTDHVFAFVGNSIFNYAGAAYVDQHGVPDVGGEPITNAYDQYSHLWSIYGTQSPRDGVVGWDGMLSGGTEIYHYFASTLGARTAGVVAYNQADSQRFADLTARALQREGYTVVREQLDFAVPSWDSAAIDLEAHHVDILFDALDAAGNVSLCRAMDTAGLHVKAKVVTVQSWTETVRSDYRDAATCRNSLYAAGTTRNYMDTDDATVKRFRDDMTASFPDREAKLSMWELEGWASAQWLDDAAQSCGQSITRTCVEAYLARPTEYDGHGVLAPRDFIVTPKPTTRRACIFAARWEDDAYGGDGGWVTTTGKDPYCYDAPQIWYSP